MVSTMKPITRIFILCCFLVVLACRKPAEYPLEPVIAYDTLRILQLSNPIAGQLTDSVVVDIDFTDGDGNLGVAKDAPIDDTTNYNFFYTPYRLQMGKWVKVYDLYSKIPNLNSTGKTVPLKGKISAHITDAYFLFRKRDTIRVDIYVKDNAGNVSNTVSTEPMLGLQN